MPIAVAFDAIFVSNFEVVVGVIDTDVDVLIVSVLVCNYLFLLLSLCLSLKLSLLLSGVVVFVTIVTVVTQLRPLVRTQPIHVLWQIFRYFQVQMCRFFLEAVVILQYYNFLSGDTLFVLSLEIANMV